MTLARLHRQLAAAQIILLGTMALMFSACVPTDDPQNDKDGFTPYVPDQGSDLGDDVDQAQDMLTGDQDMDKPADDMGAGQDMDSAPDMTIPTTCLPNYNGEITRAEVPLRAGLNAKYKVAQDTPVDTAGEDIGEGMRSWDLSLPLTGDKLVLVEAQDPLGLWFSTSFPDASYVTRLSETSELLGIFQITPDALLLLGVASPTDSFTRTRLTYDPPVKVLDFPLTQGKSWTTETTVSGTASGVGAYYSEDYSSQVDRVGSLKTPYGAFDEVLRVRVDLTRTVGFSTTRTRTFMFATECFGTVATIVSESGETEVEFGQAAEVRRLSP